MCVHLILRRGKCDSSTQCLKELHWLPIHQRIAFKILVLTHKCINKTRPTYLQELIETVQPRRSGLRSQYDPYLLLRPRIKLKTFADRSFSVAALTLWNQLPAHIRQVDLLTFKKAVKTILFDKAFNAKYCLFTIISD